MLAELHGLLNDHLAAEEQVALPLIEAHLSADEWDAWSQRSLAGLPHEDLPVVFGWLGELPPDRLATIMSVLPEPMRQTLRDEWIPDGEARRRRLYGQVEPLNS